METEKKKILIIDDDVDFLIQMKSQLEKQLFDVTTAESAKEAIEILGTMQPDLVITDLMMENFDAGIELSFRVKKINPDIPVIMVTNVTQEAGFKFNVSTEEEKSWIKSDVILNKPIRFAQLLKEIQQRLTS